MNKGDYVRTKDGYIRKIVHIEKEDGLPIELDKFILRDDTKWRNSYGLMWWIEKDDIKKSSPNIIDLIEVGDYVNGVLINDIDVYPSGKVVGYRNSEDLWEDDFKNNEIKSIVTHEQFSAMEYKVESEVK